MAVGYVVGQNGEVKPGVKILNVAKDDKSDAFSPGKMENVMSGKYPISRALNQYLNGKPTGELLEFMKIPNRAGGPGNRQKAGILSGSSEMDGI